MSVLVWVMAGIAIWHDAAVLGGLASGYLLPAPGFPPDNPLGLAAGFWPVPGSLAALAACYVYGDRLERRREAGAAQ